MDALKNAVSVISVSMILYGVILSVVPNEVLSKSVKYIASLSLLVSVCLAFKGVELDNIFDEFDYDKSQVDLSRVQNNFNQYELSVVEDSVASLINERMLNAGITDAFCEVVTDISEDGDILISEVNIYCDSGLVDDINNAVLDLGFTINYLER